jgi:hypothetical protein
MQITHPVRTALTCSILLLLALLTAPSYAQAPADFTSIETFTLNNGVGFDDIVKGPDGNFYGALSGSPRLKVAWPNGCVYKITPAGVGTILHAFGEEDRNVE